MHHLQEMLKMISSVPETADYIAQVVNDQHKYHAINCSHMVGIVWGVTEVPLQSLLEDDSKLCEPCIGRIVVNGMKIVTWNKHTRGMREAEEIIMAADPKGNLKEAFQICGVHAALPRGLHPAPEGFLRWSEKISERKAATLDAIFTVHGKRHEQDFIKRMIASILPVPENISSRVFNSVRKEILTQYDNFHQMMLKDEGRILIAQSYWIPDRNDVWLFENYYTTSVKPFMLAPKWALDLFTTSRGRREVEYVLFEAGEPLPTHAELEILKEIYDPRVGPYQTLEEAYAAAKAL